MSQSRFKREAVRELPEGTRIELERVGNRWYGRLAATFESVPLTVQAETEGGVLNIVTRLARGWVRRKVGLLGARNAAPPINVPAPKSHSFSTEPYDESRPMFCNSCGWAGPLSAALATYESDGRDDVEPVTKCPYCESDSLVRA